MQGAQSELKVMELVLGLAGGLVVFLYGASQLAEVLKNVAGDRVRNALARMTDNRIKGLLAGTVATTILDSSSVTIITLIAMVHAELLSFAATLPVILGSNIGTTISSQIFAMNWDEYSPVLMAGGFLTQALGRTEAWKQRGRVVLSFGLVLFGLHLMGTAMEPLEKYEPFISILKRMEKPLLGALAGALFTVLIQSSSATLGIIITMAGGGMVSLEAGIAMMLGAEIGTCADTLLASIGKSRDAVRAGMFHLGFNVVTVAVGIALIVWLTNFTRWISGGAGVDRQIANAHVLFNVAGALIVIPFVGTIGRVLGGGTSEAPQKAHAHR